ncbi:gp148 [Bacillus phage W.Ph.]|uniref:Gp148 n=1 Tax=Bacillus phage W.Ph. TaxID=764595 RepID=G9B1P9_9CAUD|nr:gp148 [Bacillus phage W.Ph.]ADH03294.1 gp148 [Bacillus phage W.Ph.]
MKPWQADKLIWLSEHATQEEYEKYWEVVQNECGYTDERMGTLIGFRYAVNEAFKED